MTRAGDPALSEPPLDPSPQPPPAGPGPRISVGAALRSVLRTRIAAGLLIIIPIWVTWVAVKFVFDLMTSATKPLAKKVADTLTQGNKELAPESIQRYIETVQNYLSWIEPLIAVLLTLFFLYLLGLLTANVVGRRLIKMVEALVEKVPLVKTIYRSTKQVATTLGGGDSALLQKAVVVEFPRPGMKRIAFLTSVMTDDDTGRKVASIFIPYSPYLATGYMQLIPLEEVSELDWTVEEAVKWIMSGGILCPSTIAFDHVHPVKLGQWRRGPAPAAAPPGRKALLPDERDGPRS